MSKRISMYVNVMKWSGFLRQLLKDFRYSTYKLEKVHNISSATLSKILTGKTEIPSQDTIADIEQAFKIKINDSDPENITYTMLPSDKTETGDNGFQNEVRQYNYPILSNIGEKSMMFANENIEGYASFPYQKKENCFAVRITGGNLNRTIKDGDLVLVDMDKEIVNNSIVIVKTKGGKQFIKRYRKISSGEMMFYSDDPEIEPEIMKSGDVEALYRIVGAWQEL